MFKIHVSSTYQLTIQKLLV